MNTAEYRDEVNHLRDLIGSFKACVNFTEREAAIERVQRGWRRLAMLTQPKRLAKQDADRCERYMAQAAALLSDWVTEVASGCAQAERPAVEPPAKAMADTMRFCAAAKRHGF